MRRTIIRSLCMVLFGAAALPGVADAQSDAYTNAPAELFAGPAPDYPVVAQLAPGTALDVYGCLSDYTWCDVAVPGVRGWIDAQLLNYPYQGNDVPVLEYGAIVGIPITGFAIGAYWDRYYRNRPWYHDRDRWAHRPEPRLGPGGIPPGQGHPQPGIPAPGVPAQGVPAPGGAVHDARPSAARGGWNGSIRAPAPQPQGGPAPMQGRGAEMHAPAPQPQGGPAPMPGRGAEPHTPAPSAVMHPPVAPGGAPRTMQPPTYQGGGGRSQGGNGGGNHGGGGGDGGRGDEFRH
ncbi:SH3 domain-containing protein [Burkholderia pseudomultivorans]|uniref:SH3 domain-containing protein n=1 Tax=Burkholderia pseudomultivorans TaxID=1207504 RepID=UPI000841D1BA|nr:SH3 domain-containing protein [Burkholderia pseudomultivorans]AOI88695.1 peptide-binding protein [Burkholderia pseudomultivorans]